MFPYERLPKVTVMDRQVSRYLHSTCWLLACLGMAVLQMRLLAQAYHLYGLAFSAALVAGAWLVGVLFSSLQRNTLRIWGVVFAACLLIWFAVPYAAVTWGRTEADPAPLAMLAGLVSTGLILGWTGTAWLLQWRCLPPVGEWLVTSRALTFATAGLVIVWWPWWSSPGASFWTCVVGLVLLVPLLLLDCWPLSRSPLPLPGGVVEALFNRTMRTEDTAFLLDRGALPRGWWRDYLAERGRLQLTLLASVSAVVLGAAWNAIPTPFAGALAQAHQIEKLWWLLGGQVCALAIGFGSLRYFGRHLVGRPDRLLPPGLRGHTLAIACLLLSMMGLCLAALGLPLLQSPFALGASLGGFTLAGVFWSLLLPRMRPSIRAETSAQMHVIHHVQIPRIVALRQAEEELVTWYAQRWEIALTAVITPLMGWTVDRLTLDGLLVVTGGVLLVFTALVGLAFTGSRGEARRDLQGWLGGSGVAPWHTTGQLPQERLPALPGEAAARAIQAQGPHATH